jgi:hypothetical protein
MLKKSGLILFAVVLAFSLVTCNNYDELVTPIPKVGTVFTDEDFARFTASIAGTYTAKEILDQKKLEKTGFERSNSTDNNPVYVIKEGSILVKKRDRDWDAIIINFWELGVPKGIPEATVIVKGKGTGQMQIVQPDPGYSWYGTKTVDGEFEFEQVVSIDDSQKGRATIRMAAPAIFEITGLTVKYGSTYDPLPPEPFTNNDEDAGVVFPGTF